LSSSLKEIEDILKEIKKNQKIVAISGAVPSAAMRKPLLYWDLGVALNSFAESQKVSLEDRKEWIRDNFSKIEKKIWGNERELPISVMAFQFFYHFIDKEYFTKMADLAVNKKGEFVIKKATYLLHRLSKRNSDLSPEQQKKLIGKLAVQNYSLKEYENILKEFSGNSKLSEIEEQYETLSEIIQDALDGDEKKREEIRKTIGEIQIDQIRYALQLLKMTNEASFQSAYKKARKILDSKPIGKSELVKSIINNLKIIIKDPDQRKNLLSRIGVAGASTLNMKLHIIKSKANYDEYQLKKEALKDVFNN
jgi:hypothetical protein